MAQMLANAKVTLTASELESDLSSLACHAAAELDNLLLGRSAELQAVERLAALLADRIEGVPEPASPNSMLDPTTAAVVKRAIGDSTTPATPLTTVHQLVQEAARIRKQLDRIIANPKNMKEAERSELESMRSFCLALSERASAEEESPFDREPSHPFRR
jgi:hypothetical protein